MANPNNNPIPSLLRFDNVLVQDGVDFVLLNPTSIDCIFWVRAQGVATICLREGLKIVWQVDRTEYEDFVRSFSRPHGMLNVSPNLFDIGGDLAVEAN